MRALGRWNLAATRYKDDGGAAIPRRHHFTDFPSRGQHFANVSLLARYESSGRLRSGFEGGGGIARHSTTLSCWTWQIPKIEGWALRTLGKSSILDLISWCHNRILSTRLTKKEWNFGVD